MRTNLLDFTLPALTEWFSAMGEKPFRAKQVFRWIHQRGEADFAAMTDLAKDLRAKLEERAEVRAPAILSEHRSADGTVKWLFDVGVGNGVETVFIPEDDRGTLCVSSQVGCALDCGFCSTGRSGFNRDLSAAEILGQLWVANRRLEALAREGMPYRLEAAKAGLTAGVFFGLATMSLRFIYGDDNRGLIPIDGGYMLIQYVVSGALIGGLLFDLLRIRPDLGKLTFTGRDFLAAVVGSVILLILVRWLKPRFL